MPWSKRFTASISLPALNVLSLQLLRSFKSFIASLLRFFTRCLTRQLRYFLKENHPLTLHCCYFFKETLCLTFHVVTFESNFAHFWSSEILIRTPSQGFMKASWDLCNATWVSRAYWGQKIIHVLFLATESRTVVVVCAGAAFRLKTVCYRTPWASSAWTLPMTISGHQNWQQRNNSSEFIRPLWLLKMRQAWFLSSSGSEPSKNLAMMVILLKIYTAFIHSTVSLTAFHLIQTPRIYHIWAHLKGTHARDFIVHFSQFFGLIQ